MREEYTKAMTNDKLKRTLVQQAGKYMDEIYSEGDKVYYWDFPTN